jgi:RHS repeat-associated protein
MTSSGQQGARGQADLASRSDGWPDEMALEYPQASYYRVRYYDPIIGRFVSGDPIGQNGGINIFAYVGNSSADLVDPTGYYAQLDPNSRCAEVFAKAFKPGLCPDEYAKDFNQRASKIPVINVPSDKSPTAKLTENQVSGNGSLKTLGSHFFGVTYTPTAITLAGGKPVIVLGPGFSNQPQDVQYGTLIHEEVHGVTGYGRGYFRHAEEIRTPFHLFYS